MSDKIPALLCEPFTPEWLALNYCDNCQADVAGAVHTFQSGRYAGNPTKYCGRCWDVVKDLENNSNNLCKSVDIDTEG